MRDKEHHANFQLHSQMNPEPLFIRYSLMLLNRQLHAVQHSHSHVAVAVAVFLFFDVSNYIYDSPAQSSRCASQYILC